MITEERRRDRSNRSFQALRLQLESSKRSARCRGMILADEDGLCLAATGDELPHDEIAALAALIANKVENYEGVLQAADRQWNVRIRRFHIQGTRLFVCAIGGGGEARAEIVHRSVGGVSRILGSA